MRINNILYRHAFLTTNSTNGIRTKNCFYTVHKYSSEAIKAPLRDITFIKVVLQILKIHLYIFNNF